MGSNIVKQSNLGNDTEVNKDSFKYIDIISNGNYFKLWKVRMKKNNKNYIMKQMIKSKLIDKTLIDSVINERKFLVRMHHPFIVNMHYSFQDEECLYLIYDCLSGEDLGYYIEKQRTFNENQIKFFASCALFALEYCISNKIVHNNVNPDSFMLTTYGYIKLHEFSLARIYQKESNINGLAYSNGIGYIPPEVICGLSPMITNDLFSIGVICYEMMNGRRPYEGESLIDIRNQMMVKEILVKEKEHNLWSHECIDFINGLLKMKPYLRLGYSNYSQVKNHPWLGDVDRDKLYNQEILSPFISQRNFSSTGNNTSNRKTKRLYVLTQQTPNKTIQKIGNPYTHFLHFNRAVMDREDKLLGHTYLYNNPHRKMYERQLKEINSKEDKCEFNTLSRNNTPSSSLKVKSN